MAAFASGSSGDEDMLSSLASDVKHVKKEENLSLLRELKDFRAPATEIEAELSGVFQRMSTPQPTRKKDPSATKGIK
jgi:FKBP-type peptidyl-prolyl cis-trans isomerase (trigger factor)